jgi:hypothetical protein
MAKRKPTARVQVPVRMLEALRARLEKSAKARGVSLNGEIVGRLHDSFANATSFLTDVLGSREKLLLALEVAAMINEAEKETGRDWLDDDTTYLRAARKISNCLCPFPTQGLLGRSPTADLKEIREIMNARFRRFE